MRMPPATGQRGFALVIVMIVITVLGLLAGSFAFSMKVETRLAQNANHESELEWLGRSGVEMARYVLGQSMNQPYTSLNQIWAGGPGGGNETNSVLIGISLQNNTLGAGTFSIKIRDLDSKFNINMVDQEIINRALGVIGVDAGDAPVMADSILDWRDPDDDTHLSGTESDFYLGLRPPYYAKNGAIDDLAELLLVRGVTPEVYWGPRVAYHQSQMFQPNTDYIPTRGDQPVFPVGLVDLFTPISGRQVNINTASIHVLQMLPGTDDSVAGNIIRARSGPDGVDGTEDDTPFQNLGILTSGAIPGINPQAAGLYARFCGVMSATFEVTVDARIGEYRKQFVAVLRRLSPRDIQVLQFSWN